jgi:hypothetical protein
LDLFLGGGDLGDSSVGDLLSDLGEMSVTGLNNGSALQGDNSSAGGVGNEGGDNGVSNVSGVSESISVSVSGESVESIGLTLLASELGVKVLSTGNLVSEGLHWDGSSVSVGDETGGRGGESSGVEAVVSAVSKVSGVSQMSVSGVSESVSVSVSGVSVVSVGIGFTFADVVVGDGSGVERMAHTDSGGSVSGSGVGGSGLGKGLEVVGLSGFYVGVQGGDSAIVVVHKGGGGVGSKAQQNLKEEIINCSF